MKVAAGENAAGTDIEVPLSGLHRVSGTVTALADGHALAKGTVRLLYADDRETARESDLDDNGDFAFDYVPDGKYILVVSGAVDEEKKDVGTSKGEGQGETLQTVPVRIYAGKEMPVTVMSDVENLTVPLSLAVPSTTPAAAGPPAG